MSYAVYDLNPLVEVPVMEKKAYSSVGFGKLVTFDPEHFGLNAGRVKVTTGYSCVVLGVAARDAYREDKNNARQYNHGDMVKVKALAPGKIYTFYANGAVDEGQRVIASTNGDVAPLATGNGDVFTTAISAYKHSKAFAVALERVENDRWGKFLVLSAGR